MKEIFKEIAKDFKLSPNDVRKMWEYQFQFIMDLAKKNIYDETAPKVKLEGFGTFKPNVNQILKYKEIKKNYDSRESKITGTT
jgi:nucleoid DNA-binding protein